MSHAITIGGLLCALGIIAGIAAIGFGILMAFAGGMSDAPQQGDATSKQGCTVAVVGALLAIGCIIGLIA